jgi:hypothetical protein
MQILSGVGAPLSAPTAVDYLVVAAGGGGAGSDAGNYGGGGGGAGGFRTDTNFAVTPGVQLTVTVGAGGAGGASGNNNGVSVTIQCFQPLLQLVAVVVRRL